MRSVFEAVSCEIRGCGARSLGVRSPAGQLGSRRTAREPILGANSASEHSRRPLESLEIFLECMKMPQNALKSMKSIDTCHYKGLVTMIPLLRAARARFRGGLSLCASARGLSELMASEELHEDLEALKALALEGAGEVKGSSALHETQVIAARDGRR